MNQIVASTPVFLDGERENVRTNETLLGHIIADSLAAYTAADVAFMNGGGIRVSIPAGQISRGQIITVLPFGNTIVTINATGSTILAALEHSAAVYPEQNGGWLHTAGLTYTINVQQPAGSRISNVLINGVPLVATQNYVVALPDFLASGGDGFAMFTPVPRLGEFATDDVIFVNYLVYGQPNFSFTPRVTWVR